MKKSRVFWVPCLLAILMAAGCSEVKGTITDADTGAPIVDAEVGLVVYRPFAFFPTFSEAARADASGEYGFVHRESYPKIYVQSPGYLRQTQSIARIPSITKDFQLQSIAGILGDWNVTLNIANVTLSTTRFVFSESGVQWFSGLAFLGDIEFEINGNGITIDNVLIIGGDIVAGEMTATLELDETLGTLTGEISFNHFLLEDAVCNSGCGGTLVAERVGS